MKAITLLPEIVAGGVALLIWTRRIIPDPLRIVAALGAFALAWLGVFLTAAGTAPQWEAALIAPAMVLCFYGMAAALDSGEGRGRGGGGGQSAPPEPPLDPDWRDPDWWPEFEREFASYVAERARRDPGTRANR